MLSANMISSIVKDTGKEWCALHGYRNDITDSLNDRCLKVHSLLVRTPLSQVIDITLYSVLGRQEYPPTFLFCTH